MKNPDLKNNVIENEHSDQQSITDLDRLRNLLVGIDPDQANNVIDRVSNTALRGRDLHEVFIDAIEQLEPSEQEAILKHFSEVTKSRLQQYVTEKPDEVSAIIYPVMLPAIRSAVADSIRSALERIDDMFKSKLSPQSIKWRFEAKRKGVSYGEVFLRNTINYGVEEAFLIDTSSGMLMQHVSKEGDSKKDEDAVSAMFLAIERFVNDSFNDSDEALRRVTVGERVVHIAHGPKALLACVVRGSPPSDFLADIQSILERIHAAAPKKLSAFAGDKDTLATVTPLMQECLELEIEKETEENTDDFNKKMKVGTQLFMLALLLLAGLFVYNFMQNKRINNYVDELSALSHVQIFTAEKKSGKWLLNGIIDNTTENFLPQMPKSIFVNQEKVDLNLTPIKILPPMSNAAVIE